MAKISPFKAIRPIRDKVHLVATRPYYTYKKKVLEAKLQDNPFTFIHIINPEFGEEVKTEPNSDERFQLVSQAYQEFIDKGILVQDVQPHIYLYRQTKDNHEYVGVIAGVDVVEYASNKIKKHEATLTSREKMFTNYLNIVGYNAEPVLLSYSDPSDSIDDRLLEKMIERPEYEYSTTDRIKHELWLLTKEESTEIQSAFEKIDSLYIADGHHRSASSVALKNFRNQTGDKHYPNENAFLAFIMNEKRLHILEFNRLVTHLNGHSKESFIVEIEKHFSIQPIKKAKKPKHEHQLTMCLEGKWYMLECHPEIIKKDHPVKSLDAEILTDYILDPILGIKDLKQDESIDFISGLEKLKKTEKRITNGPFKVGFFLFPVKIEEVKKVADNNLTMPPKSTWVEPKLRSGLTIYNINE